MRNQYGIFTAIAVASLAFMACDRSDAPTASDSAKPQAPDQSAASAPLDAGRLATPEEVNHLLSLPVVQAAGTASENPSGPALAKSAAVAVTCTIGFNSSNSLSFISDHGASTFIYSPYTEMCNNKNYWVRTNPINLDHFHLVAEAADQCYPLDGTNNWGHGVTNVSCKNTSDAMWWPRSVMNMNSNTGVVFTALGQDGVGRNMDLNALYVKTGSIKVLVYRVGIGWWYWPNLNSARRWYWTGNNTNLSEIRVFDTNENGTYTIDNLEVGVYQ
jgi:hypothetical protein